MRPEAIREQIGANAVELRNMCGEVSGTAKHRGESAGAWHAWQEAARRFREQYDRLAFPGGVSSLRERLQSGDPFAAECALCFLEVRSYFFRSGYLFKDLTRWCKRVPFTPAQEERYRAFVTAYQTWREQSHK